MKTMLLCDVCAKPQQVLIRHRDSHWSVCNRCFEQADTLALTENREPDGTDFARLRKKNVSGISGA